MPAPAFGPGDVGTVVTLRVRTRAGPTDLVGTVVAVAADTITLRRRDGRVEQVARADVVTGRRVPPSPAQRIDVRDLELLVARGWRALDEARVGAWLLRAAGGFTRRANSALVAGDPAQPTAPALRAVTRWYADRGLPPLALVPDAGVAAEVLRALDDEGWTHGPGAAQVMTGELGPVLRATPATDAPVRVDDAPDDAWLAVYRRADGPLPPVAREILVNHPAAAFVSVRSGGECVAIARATVDDRWAGLFAVEVLERHRRHGLGRAVSVAALRWAGRHGARHVYLQTAVGNEPAVALYAGLGFSAHHGYRFRVGSVER